MDELQRPGIRRRRLAVATTHTSATSNTSAVPAEAITLTPAVRRNFPYFDSLRAVAALMVLVVHVGWTSGITTSEIWGRVIDRFDAGVAVFFVISGFLLYRPFVVARLVGKPPPNTARYAKRRALRIVPAYWFALTALAVFPGLPGVFTGDWWRFYGFMQIYNTDTQFQGLSPAWSLCVEASFYVLLPLYAYVMWRTQRGRPLRAQVRTELIVLALLAVSSFLNSAIWSGRIGPMDAARSLIYTLPFMLDWFAIGMSLALISAALEISGSRPRIVAFIEAHPLMIWVVGGGVWLLTTIPRNDPGTIHHLAAGFFGLIHGLAFASALGELGLTPEYRLVSIFGFNIGIEAMQLAVVAATLPSLLLLSRIRGYAFLRIGGGLFGILTSLGWIMERSFNTGNVLNPLVERLAHHAPWIAAGLLMFGLATAVKSIGTKKKHSLHSHPPPRGLSASRV